MAPASRPGAASVAATGLETGQAERLARGATGAESKRDRQAAHQRRRRGHHDRAEADQARLVDGGFGVESLLVLRLKGEVNHHDVGEPPLTFCSTATNLPFFHPIKSLLPTHKPA